MSRPPPLRFDPPPIEITPEVDWLLGQAFGERRRSGRATGTPRGRTVEGSAAPERPAASGQHASPPPRRLDAARTIKLGKVLALWPRIRSRGRREEIQAALDDSAMWLVERMRRQASASALRHEEVCRQIAAAAAEEPTIPVIFLKGMALQLTEVLAPGSRLTADIDVLVPAAQAAELRDRLLAMGSRPSGLRDTDQHLSVITHRLGAPIEIHYELRGIDLGPTGATAERCLELGLAVPVHGWPAHCYVAAETLTVAHLLEHALAHHGRSPASYPGFQFLADLQDLGYSTDGKPIAADSRAWIAAEVGDGEIDAALDLLARLATGEPASRIAAGAAPTGTTADPTTAGPTDADPTSADPTGADPTAADPAALLLRHLLAGALDADYRRSLKLGNQLRAGDGSLRADWPARIGRALWLTPAQIDILYGKPKSRLGYLGWRLWRPFHLVGKSVASAAAWWKLRRLG